MPTSPLIRLFITRAALGAVIGLAVLGFFVVFDIFGMGGFIARSRDSLLALFILGLSFASMFAAVTISAAVLALARYDEPPPNSRLERWRKGGSAELPADKPLPRA
jgi:hypothetical protein